MIRNQLEYITHVFIYVERYVIGCQFSVHWNWYYLSHKLVPVPLDNTVECRCNAVQFLHDIPYDTMMKVAKLSSDSKLTTDDLYLAPTGELRCVCCEDTGRNWPCCSGTALCLKSWFITDLNISCMCLYVYRGIHDCMLLLSVSLLFMVRMQVAFAFGNGKGLSPSRCHVCARSNADWSLLWKRYHEKYITFYVDCMPRNWYWLSRQLCCFHREIWRSWSVTSSDIASTCLYVSSHTPLSVLIASLFCTLRILVVFGLGSGWSPARRHVCARANAD